ncbi:MAG TPA: dihydrodipicolinate synthase family protein, partial [Anaerolineales bacterium]|nr:dihydrodipicolinate synthase family protein [Anaerolineales bacterium]
MNPRPLQGVFAAAVTPLLDDFSPDADRIPELLSFLAVRGCHGALILGTTGEGPSFSPLERRAIFAAAARVREVQPEFVLLGGTGTPSLQETVELNRTAFELGFDGVVVLPPYYYRNAPEEGLLAWFTEVIRQSVPTGGALLGYHIPAVSGVPITINLLRSLSDRFPRQFAGLKDSSGDADHALALGQEFSPSLAVFNGNDSLFNLALTTGAAGCITAPANLISPMLRRMWDSAGDAPRRDEIEGEIEVARRILDG